MLIPFLSRLRLLRHGARLVPVCILLAATSLAGPLHRFSTSAECAQWAFSNGPEYPGARGSLLQVVLAGNGCAELRYDFRPQSPVAAGYDPRYVQATRKISAAEGSGQTRLRLRIWKSRADLKAFVRWVDASGQTLQVPFTGIERLEQQALGWQLGTLDLTHALTYWGGNNNGRTQFPIRELALICDGSPVRDSGWLRFDDVELLPPATSSLNTFSSASEVSAWTFTNGPAYPGARGSWTHATSGSATVAKLAYNFSKPTNWTGSFAPKYVGASRTIPSNATGVRVRFTASQRNVAVRLRYTDGAGQTFETTVSPGLAAEGVSAGTWLDRTVYFLPSNNRWGGPDDGVVHFPVTKVSLAAFPATQAQGYILFDSIKLIHEPVPTLVPVQAPVVLPSAPLGALSDRTGVNLHGSREDRVFAVVKEAGFGWVRVDAYWDHVERQRGVYDWTSLDAAVTSAERRHLKSVVVLNYGNTLHTGGSMTPPRTTAALTAYGNFCAAAARRYAGRPVAFELWNEPDVPAFWNEAPSAAEFGALLRTGLQRIRTVNASATVLTGAFSAPYDRAYAMLGHMVAAGDGTLAKGLGMHLYGTAAPELQWQNILRLRSEARTATGGSLWCTEWGFTSTDLSGANDGRTDEARQKQAILLCRQMLVGWWAGLPLNIVYDIRDPGLTGSDREQNFGLLTYDYEEKPALQALRRLLALARGRNFVGLLQPAELPLGVHLARLEDAASRVHLIWSEDDAAAPVAIASRSSSATLADLYGKPVAPISTGNGKAWIVAPGAGPYALIEPR